MAGRSRGGAARHLRRDHRIHLRRVHPLWLRRRGGALRRHAAGLWHTRLCLATTPRIGARSAFRGDPIDRHLIQINAEGASSLSSSGTLGEIAMQFLQAFPIAIIDEDYEGEKASGMGMRKLAEAIEKEGFRVVAGVSYEDAKRLAEVFNNESCWLVSVDGAEAGEKQWQVLEEILATKRRRNDRLPIFLFGDERTAEMVPASVLKHAN